MLTMSKANWTVSLLWLILCVSLAEPPYPDISVILFLDKIYISVNRLRGKQTALHNVSRPHPIVQDSYPAKE